MTKNKNQLPEEPTGIDLELDWQHCDPKKSEYVGVYNCLQAFTDANIFWRMAKEKLFREKHPAFYTVGAGIHRKVVYNAIEAGLPEEKVFMTITRKMYQIKAIYDAGYGRFGQSVTDVIEALYEESDDEKIIRRLSK